MNPSNETHWMENNRAALGFELDWLRGLLKNTAQGQIVGELPVAPVSAPTLNFLSRQFSLSPFERAVVLLCVGPELEADLGQLCADVQGVSRWDGVNFGLALAVLPEAHWSALAPHSPLRHWRILNLADPTRLLTSRMFLDETILYFLLGIGVLDARVAAIAHPLVAEADPSPSHRQRAELVARLLAGDEGDPPIVALVGNDLNGARAVAMQASVALGARPMLLRGEELPVAAEDRDLLARLMTREHLLAPATFIVEIGESTGPFLGAFLDRLGTPVILLGRAPAGMQRGCISLSLRKPVSPEQRSLWQGALQGMGISVQETARLTAHFNFSASDIRTAAGEAGLDPQFPQSPIRAIWRACQRRTRGDLEPLAQRIIPQSGWEDLVLPAGQLDILHDIVRQVCHRATVYEEWGFAAQGQRGLGISALFAGESGTGKTLAAEVIAADLALDLYRIDLAAVVSKYIGETEKNLERLFSAAESSGAVLLFDEADALFGRRSEVKDSHDRYANIELAYLLQRMETYRGLSILTTNVKAFLDSAFLRRIRFVVHFPFPDLGQRAEIWRRVFPNLLPREDIKVEQLAQLHVAGGNIRNIAMHAAFLAADDGGRVNMAHLARAARLEYAKIEKPLSEAEIGSWR